MGITMNPPSVCLLGLCRLLGFPPHLINGYTAITRFLELGTGISSATFIGTNKYLASWLGPQKLVCVNKVTPRGGDMALNQ